MIFGDIQEHQNQYYLDLTDNNTINLLNVITTYISQMKLKANGNNGGAT